MSSLREATTLMGDTPVNAFIGKPTAPNDSDLTTTLGAAKAAWDQLLTDLEAAGVTGREWKSYSAKSGWALRAMKGKRTIVWMSAFDGAFQAAFILSDKAVAAAREAGFSSKVIALLDQAPRYPEGTGLRLHIKTPRDLPGVRKLIAIKLAH